MNIHFAPDTNERRVKIKVVGVGGAGGNAVNHMIEAGLSEVDFYAVNTDGQALDISRAHQTLIIGSELTRGLGAGGDPSIGRAAAEEDRDLIASMVEDADMVFVTAGMGGGTGTGAAPVVAEVARESGALTVAVVTRPFMFEGFRREEQASSGLAALREQVDALLVIPNERLMDLDLPDNGMTEVFRVADNVLYEATRGISDIIAQRAVVNLDFADVRTVMKDSGAAIMGTGHASGQDRAVSAAEAAINSPLLENVNIKGSRAVLVYITAAAVGRDDLRGAMDLIQTAAGSDAHIFFGFANDESLGEELQVTVIATGFPVADARVDAPAVEDVVVVEEVVVPEEVEQVEEVTVEAEIDIDVTPAVEDPAPIEVIPLVAEAPMVAETPLVAMESEVEQRPEPVVNEPEPVVETAPQQAVFTATVEPLPVASEPPVEMEEPIRAEPLPVEAPMPPPVVIEVPEERALHEPVNNLAALAAAAGGQARVVPASVSKPMAPQAEATPSETSRRFLDPLGSVNLNASEQPTEAPQPNQRFRSSVLSDDKMRPAWERKYVD